MRIYVDKLAKGLRHPVSRHEVRKYLRALPEEHVWHVRSVRLSNAWRRMDGQLVRGSRIEVFCAVDEQLRKKHTGRVPSEKRKTELHYFGGEYREVDGEKYVVWESAKKLKRWVRFVLYHEAGHIVYYHVMGKRGVSTRAEEKFCDEYAYRYLKKELDS